jgi:hypothetical protein
MSEEVQARGGSVTIDFKFSIGDRVRIVDLGKLGVVKGMLVTARGVEFVVRYPMPNEFLEVSFFESELEGL